MHVCRRSQPGRQSQQEQTAEFPSLSSSSSSQPLPPGLHLSTGAFTQPPPPPPSSTSGSTWGPSRLASQHDPKVSKPDPRSDRPRTPGWGQAESLVDQAAGHTWDDDDDASYLSSSPPPRSPHRVAAPTDTLHPSSAWAAQSGSVRPSSARSLALTDSSGASTSGRGHMAVAPGMLQPGMSAPNQGWSAPGASFGPHSSDPQIPHRLYDQLASPNDPVVSLGFAQRAAPARSHYDPAGPLRDFVNQERNAPAVNQGATAPVVTPASAGFDSDDFLSNLLNENQLDNRPVSDIYSAAPVGGAGADTAHWPGLADAPPAAPGTNNTGALCHMLTCTHVLSTVQATAACRAAWALVPMTGIHMGMLHMGSVDACGISENCGSYILSECTALPLLYEMTSAVSCQSSQTV